MMATVYIGNATFTGAPTLVIRPDVVRLRADIRWTVLLPDVWANDGRLGGR